MKKLKLINTLLCFIPSTAFAGQGMFTRFETELPEVSIKIINEQCSTSDVNIGVNKNLYNETSLSGSCFFESSYLDVQILFGQIPLRNYRINYSSMAHKNGPKVTMLQNFDVANSHQLQTNFNIFPRSSLQKSQDTVVFHIQKSADHWQGDNFETIGNKALNAVPIKGTHDTGTYAISSSSFLTKDAATELLDLVPKNILAGWSKTQNTNVSKQLDLGIRYLDIRLCGENFEGNTLNEIYTCHTLSGDTFSNIVAQTVRFFNAPSHQREVVIFDINHLYGLSDAQLDQMTKMLTDAFGSKIASPLVFTPQSTYLDLWNQNKQVIILMDLVSFQKNSFLSLDQYRDIYWPQKNISSPWPNTRNAQDLIFAMDKNLSNRPKYQFFVLQSQETPNTNVYLKGINSAAEPTNLLEFTGIYQNEIWKWLFDNRTKVNDIGNIVIDDFVIGR